MKFAIKTLGCKVNTYESNYLREQLLSYGGTEVSMTEGATIYVINSCTITKTADRKTMQLIKQIRRQHPEAILIVLGCYVELYWRKVEPFADIIIGNNQKTQMVALLEEFFTTKKQQICLATNNKVSYENMQIAQPKQTRAFVKIQDGCDNYCAYCIVPYVRGEPRSRCYHAIVMEIKQLVANGYLEIVLTGINTAAYGKDIGCDLVFLLEQIMTQTTVIRVRLSSIEITAINQRLLDFLARNDRLVDHLHIPLQAGSNKILAQMNRTYTAEDYVTKIAQLRQVRPNMLLTTDIMVGFPGETAEDFAATLQVVEQVRFWQIHIFSFSAKEFTAAKQMKNQISQADKKNRQQQLKQLSNKISQEHLQKYIGKRVTVIFEQKKQHDMVGYSAEYLLVKTKYQKRLLKTLVNVTIKEIDWPYLKGVIE